MLGERGKLRSPEAVPDWESICSTCDDYPAEDGRHVLRERAHKAGFGRESGLPAALDARRGLGDRGRGLGGRPGLSRRAWPRAAVGKLLAALGGVDDRPGALRGRARAFSPEAKSCAAPACSTGRRVVAAGKEGSASTRSSSREGEAQDGRGARERLEGACTRIGLLPRGRCSRRSVGARRARVADPLAARAWPATS